MSTARDLIRRSLFLIGAIADGEAPTASAAADGLESLNDMIESWSLDRLIIPVITSEKFVLTPGEQSRTMGPSGNFVTARPLRILSALIEDQSNSQLPQYPMDEPLNNEQWNNIRIKSTTAAIPRKLYPEDTFPNATINFWPIPSVANKVVINSLKPLATFASIDDDLDFPPGYQRAIRYNLAIELAPEYGKTVSAEIAKIADESKASIQRMNIKPEYLACDAALVPRKIFNIYTGV